MMRYGFVAAGVLAAGLLAVSSVQAAEQPRIGVVDLQEVILKSQAWLQAQKMLQPLELKFQDQVSDSNNKLQVLKQQLDKTDKKASNYAQLQKNFEDTRSQLQQSAYLMRQDLLERQQELLNPIKQDLGKVLDQYAKAHHYDIILSKDVSGAVYANNKYDVSQGVTAALDKDWPQFQKQLQQQKSTAPAAKSGG